MNCRFCNKPLGVYERCQMRRTKGGEMQVAHDYDCLFEFVRMEGKTMIYRLKK